jgi:NAD-dependent dihydropyrimidine dehydrogenase PreA subunit
MILNRTYYSKISLFKAWWFRRQVAKFTGERVYKTFKLFKSDWPNKLYFYSPRLKGKPRFIGTPEELTKWQERHLCETICPTNAIKLTAKSIEIDERGCISCGLCIEVSPPGLLEFTTEASQVKNE